MWPMGLLLGLLPANCLCVYFNLISILLKVVGQLVVVGMVSCTA